MPAPSAEVFDRLRNLAAIKDVAARPTRTIDEVFTGKPLTTIPVGTAADVEAAFAEARAAQTDWAKRPVIERAAVIRRYRDLVIENREFLMDLLQAEAGKARWAAQEEIVDLIANANYYARVCVDLLKPRKAQPLLPGIGKTTVCYQPKGVVPPARSGGLAQVHRITDDRDRPRVQSRSALRHPGHSLAEVTVTHRAHRDEASRPQVTARPSAT